MPRVEQLVREAAQIIKPENVTSDSKVIARYSRDYSFVRECKPLCVAFPENAVEVQKMVKWSNSSGVPLIPVSSGEPHFYGDTVPSEEGIIIDLTKMNQVIGTDTRNKAVTIQPGVTWGQLQAELRQHGLRVVNPLLPRSSKSVVTSILETVPPLVPKFEYADPILSMEVVLPSGETLRTGSASPDHCTTDMVCPFGPGFNWNVLVECAQGTLGIVTWMKIKAEPLPALQRVFFIVARELTELVEPLYQIQRRMIGYECFVINNFNLASILAKRWPQEFDVLRKTLPEWTLILCLAGLKRFPQQRIEYEHEALEEICQNYDLTALRSLPGLPKSEERVLALLPNPCPDDSYWKLRYKGSCFDIPFLTTLDRAPEYIETVYSIAERYSYPLQEIGIYIQPLEYGRACHCEYGFHCRPDDLAELEKIEELYYVLSKALISDGAYFSRPYGQWAKIVYESNPSYATTLRKIKMTFDPNNVLNPGKIYL
jgi:FAD/FMN-containing dehydrogenase